MITSNNSNCIGGFRRDHDVVDKGNEENALKRTLVNEATQYTSKRIKLTEQNHYLSLEEVSEMLDEAYYRDKKLDECKQTSTVAMEIIEDLSKDNREVVLSEEEEVDRLRCLAYVYEHKGKYEKALPMWEKLATLRKGSIAFNKMGMLYSSDCSGITRDFPKAVECFKKGSRKKDLNATFNAALTFDMMRDEAEELKEKNTYRRQARHYYDKVAKVKRPTDSKVAVSKFNTLFLSHLDKNGAFAPEKLHEAKVAYEGLSRKYLDDARVPLMRASVEYLINNDKTNPSYNMFYRWLETSAEKGNSVAVKLLKHKGKPSFEKKFEAYLKEPQKAYKQHTQYDSNVLY